MTVPSKNQKGFSTIEQLAVLLVACFITIIGLRIYHNNASSSMHKAHVIHATSWSTYSSKHSSISFQYPKNWAFKTNAMASIANILENITITGSHGFTIDFSLQKTDHNPVIHNADCAIPPTITKITSLSNKLDINYASYDSVVNSMWLNSVGSLRNGYGYATGQCRNNEIDYISLPNDLYAQIRGYYYSSTVNTYSSMKSTEFFKQPEVKTALDIFKSLSY